jgi:hypothetical protein
VSSFKELLAFVYKAEILFICTRKSEDPERIMKQKTGMSHMLYLAVIKIKKWNLTDFEKPGISNQEITEQVIERLEKEKQR